MLFAAFRFPSLPLDVFARAVPAEAQARPFVVDSGGHVPRIVALNEAARAAGLREGMLLSAAYALAPDLVQQARDLPAEAAALEQLATFVLGFTPATSLVPPDALVAEIGSSLKLFGGRRQLCARLEGGLRERGFETHAGAGPTPLSALAFARAGTQAVATLAALPASLDPLSLAHFDLPEDARTMLAAAGVTTFGDADRLPRAGLARRLGPDFVAMLDRAAGRMPDPREPFVPPPQFHAKLELPATVHDVEALGFAVHRLVQDLAGWLLSRGLGVTALSLALFHERALVRHRDSPCTQAQFALGAPSRTPKHLMHVLRERLARLKLPAPVAAVTLGSESVVPLASRNLALLPGDEGALPEVPLLDRLRARLGDDAVRLAAIRADHRPEFATTWEPASHTRARSEPAPAVPRPLWLLREPQPLAAMLDAQPWILRDGPERIESGWWDGRDVRRDYFVAQSPQGEIVWIYRDHRRGTDDGEWFLHGVFA